MSKAMQIRAWKDEEFRLSLSGTEQALLAENPAGSLELTDAELETVSGAGIICGNSVLVCGFSVLIFCSFSFLCGGTVVLGQSN